MNHHAAENFIVNELRRGLSPTLYYHGLHHTLDVAEVALELATAEGLTDPEPRVLLRTAALYHDAGFLQAYQGHEAQGCALARATLPGFGYTPDHIEQICALIMATQYPQEPQSHLAEILCDADLDYLGRDDFEPISTSLFHELTARQLIAGEHAWFQLQANFLTGHRFWTRTTIARRAAPKQARLDHILALLANWPTPGPAA
ncbi:HD domain-containing protein [Hymenobacter sp. BT523]|uniref:HD domain-containing protein n=1 Tax=Hymenobacter sp. BT523 TaxID=2795725 RepID=UPI0018EA4B0E|nr:HD domain-containing protein [Hymenobacter sp. BT523]MBJ6109037.1 HD domain-containing protein [Hymenobacter sp. BT523]